MKEYLILIVVLVPYCMLLIALIGRWWIFQKVFAVAGPKQNAIVVGYRYGAGKVAKIAAFMAYPKTSSSVIVGMPTRAPVAGQGTMGAGLYTFLTFLFLKLFLLYSLIIAPLAFIVLIIDLTVTKVDGDSDHQRRDVSESAHPSTEEADALAVQYTALYNQGRLSEAIPMAERLLAIREKSLGPDDPDLATLLNNLAALYTEQGRYSAAEPLYRRSLAIKERAFGPDDNSNITTLDNLAELYRVQDRYLEAERLYRRVLAIRERVLGPDHPDVARTLNDLAALYSAQGRNVVRATDSASSAAPCE